MKAFSLTNVEASAYCVLQYELKEKGEDSNSQSYITLNEIETTEKLLQITIDDSTTHEQFVEEGHKYQFTIAANVVSNVPDASELITTLDHHFDVVFYPNCMSDMIRDKMELETQTYRVNDPE